MNENERNWREQASDQQISLKWLLCTVQVWPNVAESAAYLLVVDSDEPSTMV